MYWNLLVFMLLVLFRDFGEFTESCPQIRIRKEIHTLTPSEVSHFVAAIKQLHANKNSDGISKLDEFVKIHLDIGAFAHG